MIIKSRLGQIPLVLDLKKSFISEVITSTASSNTMKIPSHQSNPSSLFEIDRKQTNKQTILKNVIYGLSNGLNISYTVKVNEY